MPISRTQGLKKMKRASGNCSSSADHNSCTSHPAPGPPPLTEVILKSLEGVPYKWQCHFRRLLLLWRRGGLEPAVDLHRVGGLLFQVLGGEVGGIDVGRQARLEGGAEAAKIIEIDAREEGVSLQLVGPAAAEAVLAVADETVWRVRWG